MICAFRARVLTPFKTVQEIRDNARSDREDLSSVRDNGDRPCPTCTTAPYATFLMAMAGATVIKVEPHGGEHLRSRGDMGGADLPFAMLNSNKNTVTLNLKTEQGKALLLEMTDRADILVENFAPGVMDRLGVGANIMQQRNPRLIYGSSSGYGEIRSVLRLPRHGSRHAGDERHHRHHRLSRPCTPVKSGPALCDFSAASISTPPITTALYQRERTGKGRVVEVTNAGLDLFVAGFQSRHAARPAAV